MYIGADLQLQQGRGRRKQQAAAGCLDWNWKGRRRE